MSVSIVSGNGFAGHAQRADNEYGLRNNSYTLTSQLYDLSFQYRSSHAITCSLCGDLSAATETAQTVTLNSFTANGSQFEIFLNDTVNWDDTSSTKMFVPTSHPTSETFTVSTRQPYHSGQHITLTNQYAEFTGTVVSYESGTGELVLNSATNTGVGNYSSWNLSWGEFGYSTSITNNTIPTSHPTQVTFTIDTGESGLSLGTTVTVAAFFIYFNGTITSYQSDNGSLTMDSSGNYGTGTTSAWDVSISEDYWLEVGTIDLFPS